MTEAGAVHWSSLAQAGPGNFLRSIMRDETKANERPTEVRGDSDLGTVISHGDTFSRGSGRVCSIHCISTRHLTRYNSGVGCPGHWPCVGQLCPARRVQSSLLYFPGTRIWWFLQHPWGAPGFSWWKLWTLSWSEVFHHDWILDKVLVGRRADTVRGAVS